MVVMRLGRCAGGVPVWGQEGKFAMRNGNGHIVMQRRL